MPKNRLIKRQKSYLKLAGIYYNADKDDYFFEEKRDFAGKIYMLNRKLKSLSTPVDTGEAKAPRELTADDFDALKSIYERTIASLSDLTTALNDMADECESALENERNPYEYNRIEQEMKSYNDQADLLSTVLKILNKDLKAINTFSKSDKKVTLNTVFEGSRINSEYSVVSDIPKKFNSGNQNERIPLTIKGPDGREIKGYFTPDIRPKSGISLLKQTFNKVKKKYGKDADFFSIYDYGRIHSAFNNYNDNTLSLILGNHKGIAMMSYEEAYKTLSSGMENIIKPFINTPKKLNIFLDIFATAAKVENQIDIASGIGINSKSRVNRRNAAMSKVAEMLGCSDVIAKSENIRITLNGNPVKGTFMKEATGEDLNKIDTNSVMFGLNSYSANSFNAKKQLASLQILDYICGNPDRHAGNMLYTFDKDSKGNTYLKSIQGIDNDSCFGRNPFEDVGMASVLPSDMMVIPVDICNRLMNLEPEVLKNVLYGFDLTSREVNAALKRLDTLKTKIMDDQKKYSQGYTKGYLIPDTIKVVEDKELDELILNTDLYKTKKHKRSANLFTRIKNNISGSAAVEDFLKLKAKAYENACYDVTVGNIGKVSDLIIRLDKDERLGASSPEYRAMLRALRELNEALVEFNGPVRGKGTDTFKGHVQKINEIKERYRQTLITVNEYIGYKDSKKKGEEWRLIKEKHTPSRTERRYMNALECRNFLNEQLDKIVELDIPLNEYNKARKKNKSLMNNVMLNENRYTATEELLKTFDTHANNLYNNHMSRTRYVVAQAFKDYTKCKPAFKDYYKVMLDMLIGYGLNGTKDNDRKAFRDYVEQITNIKLEGDDDAIIKRAYASDMIITKDKLNKKQKQSKQPKAKKLTVDQLNMIESLKHIEVTGVLSDSVDKLMNTKAFDDFYNDVKQQLPFGNYENDDVAAPNFKEAIKLFNEYNEFLYKEHPELKPKEKAPEKDAKKEQTGVNRPWGQTQKL